MVNAIVLVACGVFIAKTDKKELSFLRFYVETVETEFSTMKNVTTTNGAHGLRPLLNRTTATNSTTTDLKPVINRTREGEGSHERIVNETISSIAPNTTTADNESNIESIVSTADEAIMEAESNLTGKIISNETVNSTAPIVEGNSTVSNETVDSTAPKVEGSAMIEVTEANNQTAQLPLCTREQLRRGQWVKTISESAPYQPEDRRFVVSSCYYTSDVSTIKPWKSYKWQPFDESCRFMEWDQDHFCRSFRGHTIAVRAF